MTDSIGRIDFTDNNYTIKQSLIRNKYKVLDSTGKEILRARQKMFKMKEEFPFTDPEGNVVFRVKARQMMDFSGDYSIIDEETGETVVVLGKKFTLLKHVWNIKNPEGEEIASIESRSAFVELLRTVSDIFSLLPHKYTINSPEGEHLGDIKGKFSLRDTYELNLQQGLENKEVIVAAAVAIDALEHN